MGYEYADTQNSAVRCFLNQFSKKFNYFDKNYKKATLEYFNYECPYSGVKLNSKNITQDHIMPFNKEACGLHVYGNVLLVTKEVNSKKSSHSLEYFLRNEPERLLKIQEFIKRTGYEEIHKEYNQELKKICTNLYQEIGTTIRRTYNDFTVQKQAKKNTQTVPLSTDTKIHKTFMVKKSANGKQNIARQSLSKLDIKNLCLKNSLFINSNYTQSTKNSTTEVYWANPNVDFLLEDWILTLDDNINSIIHYFAIPANSIKKSEVVLRKDKPNKIDLQIQYNDSKFTDNRSGISFATWLVKSFSY